MPGIFKDATGNSKLTTPFAMFYDRQPDYHMLFKWGSVGYYRRPDETKLDECGTFDQQTDTGIALGHLSLIHI